MKLRRKRGRARKFRGSGRTAEEIWRAAFERPEDVTKVALSARVSRGWAMTMKEAADPRCTTVLGRFWIAHDDAKGLENADSVGITQGQYDAGVLYLDTRARARMAIGAPRDGPLAPGAPSSGAAEPDPKTIRRWRQQWDDVERVIRQHPRGRLFQAAIHRSLILDEYPTRLRELRQALDLLASHFKIAY